MFGLVFPEQCPLSGCICSHNRIAKIYSITANTVICVFASMVLYSSIEIASLGMAYVNNSLVFVSKLICP